MKKYTMTDVSRLESQAAKLTAKATAAREESAEAAKRVARLLTLDEDASAAKSVQAKYAGLSAQFEREAAACANELELARASFEVSEAREELAAWQAVADQYQRAASALAAASSAYGAASVAASAKLAELGHRERVAVAAAFARFDGSAPRIAFGLDTGAFLSERITKAMADLQNCAGHLVDGSRDRLASALREAAFLEA